MITYKEVADYHRDGYVIVNDVFTREEIDRMLYAVENGERVAKTRRSTGDRTGKAASLAIWMELGDDIWSAASICPRIVNPVRILLGEDAAFYHGKVMLKEAHTGGAWEWHQDYGYWYPGFVYPNLISAFVALDACTIENGCLQVLKGSHHLGRIDHGRAGTQVGVDAERFSRIEPLFEKTSGVLTPGSVLFFHSNTLHSSSANESDFHRRAFITCYSAVSNPEIVEGKLHYRPSCPVGADDAMLKFAVGTETAAAQK